MGWQQRSLLALLALLSQEGAEGGRDSIRTLLSADGAVLAFAGPAVLPGSALVRPLVDCRDRDRAPLSPAATAGVGHTSADTGPAAAEHPSTRYPVPVLVPFAVADSEVNVAVPPPARRRSSLPWAPGQPSARRRRGNQKDKPGFKPVAGLGAVLGFLAAGPAGALAGAAASVVASGKDSLAGDTVRTAAKAAENLGGAAWDVTSRAADAANVEGFVRRGIDEIGSWTSDGRPPKT
jgi:hypothetical protein